MTPKFTDDVQKALQLLQQGHDRVLIEDDDTGEKLYVVQADFFERATRALQREEDDLAAIRDGLEDVKQGRTHPLAEVDAELRSKHGLGSPQ